MQRGVTRRTALILFGLTALAVAVRLLLVEFDAALSFNGAANFASMGRNLARGAGFTNVLGEPELLDPPLFPALIALVYLATGDAILAGQVVVFVTGVLLVPAVFVLGRRLYDARTGLIAAGFVAIYPNLIRFSGIVLSEMPYTLLLILAVTAGHVALERRTAPWYALAGFLFGTTYLVRPQAVGYVLLVVVLTVGFVRLERGSFDLDRFPIRHVGTLSVAHVAAFLLTALPFVLHIYTHTGMVSLSQKASYNIYIGINQGAAYEQAVTGLREGTFVLNRDYYLQNDPGVLSYVLSNPGRMLKRYVVNVGSIYLLGLPTVVLPVVPFLVGVGLFARRWGTGRWRNELYLVCVLLYPIVAVSLFFVNPRFLVPLLPFVLLWAARGTIELGARLYEVVPSDYRPSRARVTLVVVLLVSSLVLPAALVQPPYDTAELDAEPTYGATGPGTDPVYREAGTWLDEHADPDAKVMMVNTFLPFYADRTGVIIPYANYSRVIGYGRHRGATHLFLYEPVIEERRPQLQFLLDGPADSDGLELVYERTDGETVRIYRIVDPEQ